VRIALIVNPFASRVTPHGIETVERELARAGDVTTTPTERPRHATELAQDSHRDFDAIVVFSGDGGFNEALNGADGTVPLAFVPGGGTSVLPRALGLPHDHDAAARRIADSLLVGRTRRISVGRVNGRRFGFSAGLGIDAEAVRRMDALGRSEEGVRPGDLAFALTLARIFVERRSRFEPRLEVKGLGRAATAFVANCDPYTYAGALPVHASPDARFELGLDVVAPVRVRPGTLPRILRYVFTGRGQTRAPDILYGHDLDRIEVVCDTATPLQADGEDLGDVTEAVFECEREAVSVVV
jgi:diacylglycerol kinase family enzyme